MRTYVRINLNSPNSPTLYESCVHMYVLILSRQKVLPYMNHAYTCTYESKVTKQSCLIRIMRTHVRINLKSPKSPALQELCVHM